MLHFLPDSVILWFTNILLLTGIGAVVAGLFAHRIPLVWQYQLPFKIGGLLLLAAGVYFRGGYGVEMAWRERVAAVEQRLQAAEQRGEKLNDQLSNQARQRTQIIRGRTEYITKYIDQNVAKYDNQCVIPQAFVQAHNDAARKPDTK